MKNRTVMLPVLISLILISNLNPLSNPSYNINDTEREYTFQEISLQEYPSNWTEDTRLTYAENHAVAPEVGAYGPYVHIVWQDRRDGVDRIFYKRSNDSGETWEDGLGHKDVDRRLSFRDCGRRPKISVDGFNIHLIWFDLINGTGSGALCSGTAFGTYYVHSFDNGATWSEPIIVSGSDSLGASPSDILAYNDTIHALWWDWKHNYSGKPTEATDQLFYRRSFDGGLTWEDEQRLTSTPGRSQEGILVLDGRNNILHLVYHEGYPNIEIYYMQSRDNGETWEDGLGNPLSRRNLSNDTTMSAPVSIALSSRAMHVVWVDERWSGGLAYYKIYYIHSEDNSVTWSDRTVLVDNNGIGRDPYTLRGRYADKPEIFSRGEELFMFWFDTRDDNFTGEVYFKYSPDAGSNWTEDERLTYSENAWSLWPTAAFFNQFIHLVWFDERHGYRIYEIYYKRSPEFFEDTQSPEIIHSPILMAEVGKNIPVSAQILDDFWVEDVNIRYTNVEGQEKNVSMKLSSGDHSNGSWQYEIPAQNEIGILSYVIEAKDFYGNANRTETFNISVIDSTRPEVEHFPPSSGCTGESIGIEASVRDNLKVASVYLKYTDTIGITRNVSMSLVAGDDKNGTWKQEIPPQEKPGDISYSIVVNDTSNNWNLTTAEFKVIDTTLPMIFDAQIFPDPAEVNEFSNISVGVYDNSLVEEVWIEVFSPDGEQLGNQSALFDTSTGRYFRLDRYGMIGNHSFNVSAKDANNNWNTTRGVFEVIDSTSPTIAGVSIDPAIGEIYEEVTISAIITDNYQIEGVWIEIQDPDGTTTNLTVEKGFEDVFSLSISCDKLGSYLYTIRASDPSSNWNSSSGSFLVRDSQLPQIANTTAFPNPQEVFREVSILTAIAENHRLKEVWIEILGPDGSEVVSQSMHNLTENLYYYSSNFSLLGAYSYSIRATDVSGNQNVTMGSFVVEDWTPPIADAGPDVTVKRGSFVGFNGSFSWDNVGIENYTWSFVDKGVTIYLHGRNPTYGFERNGEYLVRLTVRDASGNQGSDEITVLVREEASSAFLLVSLLWLLAVLFGVVFLLAYLWLRRGNKKKGGKGKG